MVYCATLDNNNCRRQPPSYWITMQTTQSVQVILGSVALLGLLSATPAHAQSKSSYFAAIDSNSNGGVSLAEFQSWMSYAFVRIDKNHNDVIDADEALVPKMRGVTGAKHRSNIAAQFRRQDKNHSGELSMAELTAPPAR
jgi:hypothetical protein